MAIPLYKNIDAVIVTHRDVDLRLIKATLAGFKSIIVWNNEALNLGPLGQFIAAAHLATSELVYFQDDDCVTAPELIASQYVDGILCNMGIKGHEANYVDKPDKLMGFGSIFPRALIKPTFDRFWSAFPIDPISWREPGRIFTAMNREQVRTTNVAVIDLPWATADWRCYKQTDHVAYAIEARNRVSLVRGDQK